MHNALKYNPKGKKHNLQITNICHFHHQPLWFHLAWVLVWIQTIWVQGVAEVCLCLSEDVLWWKGGVTRNSREVVYLPTRLHSHTRMYIFKFWHEKEQYVIQFAVLLLFLCGISCTPFIQTIRYILLCLCCLMFHFVIVVIVVGSWL